MPHTPIHMDDLKLLAAQEAARCIELRRQLHRHPELSNQEFETTSLLASELERAGATVSPRPDGVGLIAEVGSGASAVAFRADLDALPIAETGGAEYASEIPGQMHACGHDAHAAIAVGIARCLLRVGDLPGRVRFLFQHAEESIPGGAGEMVDEGALDGVGAILTFHVDPTLAAGRIGLRVGPITSSSDRLEIVVEGPGGHTARPQETVDTVYAASRIVTDVPELLHRVVDSRKALALVFGQIHGGTADNVIPTKVEISGTCRLLDRELWDEMPGLIDSLVSQVVAPTGAKAVVHYQRGIPPVVNVASVIAEVEYAVAEALGTEAVAGTPASLGAEDFARFLEYVPGAMVRLGAALPHGRVDLHAANFDIDEAALETGILVGAASLLRMLECEWD